MTGERSVKGLVEPARAPDLTPQRERLPELDPDLRPRLRAPARGEHHAQNAVDAEPGVPEAGVGVVHFTFGPRRHLRARGELARKEGSRSAASSVRAFN